MRGLRRMRRMVRSVVRRFSHLDWLRLEGRLLVALSPLIPKKSSLVLFGNRQGNHYMDNSQHLFEWMLVHRRDVDAVWVTRSDEVFDYLKRSGSPVVKSCSIRGVWLLSRAGAGIITNGLTDLAIDETIVPPTLKVIFLGHGKSVKAVRLANKAPEVADRWKRTYEKFHSVTRYTIATSPLVAEFTEASHGVRSAITGYPRNDVLLNPPATVKAQWKDYLGGFCCRKVVLYGPTWRSGRPTQLFPFADFDKATLSSYLEERGILLLLRPHHKDLYEYPATRAIVDDLVTNCCFIRSASHEILPDVSTFLPFVDVLVTDYSSLYHDFLLLDRPVIFIPYDYDQFSERPGFMYDYFEHLPGPSVSTFHDFCGHLDRLCQGQDPFRAKRQALRDRIHFYQDSTSCERVAALVDRVLQES